jgi:parallel beta-helix repeat protein
MSRFIHRSLAVAFAIAILGAVMPTFRVYAATIQVVNTNDSGVGSFRQAIFDANAAAGADTIEFRIPGTGAHTIALTTAALPPITGEVIITGETEEGWVAAGNATAPEIRVEIDGAAVGGIGLQFNAGSQNSVVRGLALTNFNLGIQINAANITVRGNHIGLDIAGTTPQGNLTHGIEITSNNNTIGGTLYAARNHIAANDQTGIYLHNGATGNIISGNYIGLDDGGGGDGNGTIGSPDIAGIWLENAPANTIGGTTVPERNTISGNVGPGIFISGTSNNTVIKGNFIGLNVAGTSYVAQGGGVYISGASGTTIGGTTTVDRNVISIGYPSGVAADGISIVNASGTTIKGNYIGTNSTGASGVGNDRHGIYVSESPNTTIGGTTTDDRNIISYASDDGVYVEGLGSTNVVIFGNYIGTNSTGNDDISNFDNGVRLQGTSGVLVGDDVAGAGNLISGNALDGVYIFQGSGNFVQGNVIGLNAAGSASLTNQDNGVQIQASTNNLIGGTTASARNVISGQIQDGVNIAASGSTGNLIRGNYIGLNVNGTLAVPNSSDGVQLTDGTNNTIGGNGAGAGNVIAGNGRHGVYLSWNSSTFRGGINNVQGNYIGTNPTGTITFPNIQVGVYIERDDVVVGGTTAGARNIISGNGTDGIYIDSDSDKATIQGNYIGVAANGTTAMGNGQSGIEINFSEQNVIGGVAVGAGNVIANNTGDGVWMSSGSSTIRNSVRGNSIHSNLELGIDLFEDGVTPNDATDSDTGANLKMNFPVISAPIVAGSYQIRGRLQTTNNATNISIDFYANTTCDPTTYGEGETYIGSTNVLTDGVGVANFGPITFPVVPGKELITATATDSNGNTSEFSQCAGANLITNGGFDNGSNISPWVPFDAIAWNVNAGVFNFHMNVGGASAVVLQQTNIPLSADSTLEIQFSMGNSSVARKRFLVLVHDGDFSDSAACSFWIAPGTTPLTYTMKMRTTEAWTNATLSIYVSRPGDGLGSLNLDNVSMFYRPAENIDGTFCTDPRTPAPPGGANGPDLINNGGFTSPIGTTAVNAWATVNQINGQVVGGVAQLYRTGTPRGNLIQEDPSLPAAGVPFEATFQMGNSDTSRRMRMVVLIHKRNFADLGVCAFWIPPNTPLQNYTMRVHSTIAWDDATTISFYADPFYNPAPSGRILLDNVTLRQRPGLDILGAECYEPGSVVPAEAGEVVPVQSPEIITAPQVSLPPGELPLIATPVPFQPAEAAQPQEGSGGSEFSEVGG